MEEITIRVVNSRTVCLAQNMPSSITRLLINSYYPPSFSLQRDGAHPTHLGPELQSTGGHPPRGDEAPGRAGVAQPTRVREHVLHSSNKNTKFGYSENYHLMPHLLVHLYYIYDGNIIHL